MFLESLAQFRNVYQFNCEDQFVKLECIQQFLDNLCKSGHYHEFLRNCTIFHSLQKWTFFCMNYSKISQFTKMNMFFINFTDTVPSKCPHNMNNKNYTVYISIKYHIKHLNKVSHKSSQFCIITYRTYISHKLDSFHSVHITCIQKICIS